MKNNITDQEVYDIAVKIAKKEFHQNPSIYRCEVLDLAGDMFKFYQHYTKPYIDNAEDPRGFAIKGLYFALSSIRKFAFSESRRIVIESELFDGEFLPNTYFRMLEANGGYGLWNDNEKVIDTKKNTQPSYIDRPLSPSSEYTDLDRAEARRIMEENLTQEELQLMEMFLEGKTESWMAARLGISQPAVHKRIQKILTKLQNKG